MKILHTADWHVGRTIRRRPRDDEQREVLAEIAEIAGEEQVDLLLVAGDVFDRPDPSPTDERIVYRALSALAQVAPVVMVAGNHDHPDRWDAISVLLSTGQVQVIGRLARPGAGGVQEFRTEEGTVARVTMLPWVSKGNIVKAEQIMEASKLEMMDTYANRLQAISQALIGEPDMEKVNLVLSHMMVHGAKFGGGERMAHTILDYAVSAAALFPGGLNYVALGHLHRQQQIAAPTQVWYSGSPLQLDFGETQDEKGVLIVETEPGKPAQVHGRKLSGGKRLARIRGTKEQVIEQGRELEQVYLQVFLDEPGRTGLLDEVRDELPHAVDIRLVQKESDAPSTPDILSPAGKPEEMFRQYLEEQGVEDPQLEQLFLQMLGQAQSHATEHSLQ